MLSCLHHKILNHFFVCVMHRITLKSKEIKIIVLNTKEVPINQKGTRKQVKIEIHYEQHFWKCAVQENIHIPVTEGFLVWFSKSLNPPPLWNFQFNLILYFRYFGFWEPLPLIITKWMNFLGVGVDIFWNCTILD